jgi:hypothetical protein
LKFAAEDGGQALRLGFDRSSGPARQLAERVDRDVKSPSSPLVFPDALDPSVDEEDG